MSDAETEGGSAPSLNVPRCDVCGREPFRMWAGQTNACLRGAGSALLEEEAVAECYRLGYERLRSLINEEPRRQAPPDALAQARAEGRAAALEEAAQYVIKHPTRNRHRHILAVGIRALLNQGRDEVATSPEITREGGAPRRSQTDTEPK